MTLRTLNYGNYGIFLIMGHAGFCPSAVVILVTRASIWEFPEIRGVSSFGVLIIRILLFRVRATHIIRNHSK